MTDNKPTHSDELKAYPDEQDTAYLNIKIWLQQAIAHSAAGAYDAMHDKVATVLHHLPIIKPNRASTPPAPQAEGEVGEAASVAQKVIDKLNRHKLGNFVWAENARNPVRFTTEHLETLITAAQSAERLREDNAAYKMMVKDYHANAKRAQEDIAALRHSLSKAEEHWRWRGIDSAPHDRVFLVYDSEFGYRHLCGWQEEYKSYFITGGLLYQPKDGDLWSEVCPTPPQPAATPDEIGGGG